MTIKTPSPGDGYLQSTMTAVGKDAPVRLPASSQNGQKRFEAVLTATPLQAATVRCRPLAAESDGTAGFTVGGEVTLTGNADAAGLVGSDGFPFQSTFPRYGFEVLSITGAGAAVKMTVGG